MATALKMPQLGMTMTEAKLVRWLKHEGDPVKKGEPVATIETDKLNAEVEASADGVLRRIVAPAGTTVPVVGLMAVIAAPDETEAAIVAIVGGSSAARPHPPSPSPKEGEGGRQPGPLGVTSAAPVASEGQSAHAPLSHPGRAGAHPGDGQRGEGAAGVLSAQPVD